jgi:hypothetical protein
MDSDNKVMTCGSCGRQVPRSEAVVAEAQEYMMYFCGVDCLDEWRSRAAREYGLNVDEQAADDGHKDQE